MTYMYSKSLDTPINSSNGKDQINNKPILVRIMVWLRTGDNSLSEPMIAWFTDAYLRRSASMSFLGFDMLRLVTKIFHNLLCRYNQMETLKPEQNDRKHADDNFNAFLDDIFY